ncbi:MAG: carboxypeptidase-like regulatory domain-containing protein, partial [Planctomycetota bacterium]
PLVIAVLAAALLLFLRDPAPSADPGGGRTASEARDAAPTGGPLDGVARAGERVETRAAAAEEPALESSAAAPADAVADDSTEARGAIVGRLTDAGGAPLVPGDVELADPGVFVLNEDRVAPRVEVDAEGRFRIESDAGPVVLHAGADGYAPLEREVNVPADGTVDVGDLRLAPGVRIAGRVVDESGKPVPNARIRRSGAVVLDVGMLGGGIRAVAETDADGRFAIDRLGVGDFAFRVTHRSYPSGDLVGRTERAGETLNDLEVVLRIGGTIEGRVVGAARLAGVEQDPLRVTATKTARADGSTVSPGGLFVQPQSAAVEDDGSFTLRGLEAGASYALRAEVSSRPFDPSGKRSAEVLANVGDRGVTLEYDEGATVRFRLVDDGGRPLEGAEIRVSSGWSVTQGNSLEPAPGSYEVPQLWPTEEEPVKITAELAGYETWTLEPVPVTNGADVDLGTITLATEPELVVTVLDAASGDPVEGALVKLNEAASALEGFSGMSVSISTTISSSDSEEDFEYADVDPIEEGARTDADGVARLAALPGKRVNIDVRHPGFAEARVTRSLDASSTTFEETVRLEPGGDVRVRLVDDAGLPVTGRMVDRRTGEGGPDADPVEVDEEGVALFRGVRPGEHGFRVGDRVQAPAGMVSFSAFGLDASNEDDDWTEVVVAPGETAELTLLAPRPSALTGRVLENGEPLAGARVTVEAKIPGMPMMLGLGGGASATTDARGEYVLENLEGGACALRISHPTRSMPAEFDLELDQGENEHVADLSVTVLAGRVVDQAGEPVPGVRVKASREQTAGGTRAVTVVSFVASDGGGESIEFGGDGAKPVRTDGDGRFELRGVAPDVPLRVTATRDGGATARSEEVEVPPGGREELADIRFEDAGTLVVVTEDYVGEAMVFLTRGDGADRNTVVEGGRGKLENVTPGSYRLIVSAISTSAGGVEEVELAPRMQEIDIVAGETVTATVRKE